MNRNGRASPTQGVRHGLAGLLHDVMTLTELQLKLLAVDAKAAGGRAVVPAILLVVAALFSLSALPLLLVALAQTLRDQAGWPAALATLAAVGVGLLLAAILGGIGYVRLRRVLEPLSRSQDEFNRNVAWLKNALKRHEFQKQAEAGTPSAGSARPNVPR